MKVFGKSVLFFILVVFLLTLVIALLSRCSPSRKAQREERKDVKAVQRLLSRGNLAAVCAENYPVKDSIIRGDTVLYYDTVLMDGDIIVDTVITKDTVRITTVKTLPSKTITKTVIKVDTVIRENTAKVQACDNDKRKLIDLLSVQKKESDDWKSKAKNRSLIMWGLIALIILIAGWKIYSSSLKNKIPISLN